MATVCEAETDYLLTGVGNNAGGEVTFLVPPSIGVTVSLRRVTPRTQGADLLASPTVLLEAIEAGLDKLTLITQGIQSGGGGGVGDADELMAPDPFL